MKKILINIQNNEIIFKYKSNNSNYKEELVNTNIISNNELVFSDSYINDNLKILSSFINELTIQYNIIKITISKIELVPLILKIILKTNITYITISENENITYSICEQLINMKSLKTLNCYNIQPFMLELLDKHGIACITRSEILYISNFMESNNLLSYSNIYYKTNVRITIPLSLEDLKDFKDFCKINKYLRIVHLNKLNNEELNNILNILIETNRKNIKVIIHENVDNAKTAEYLKNINKKYKRKYQIMLSLEYSQDYLDDNIFKQTIINTLRACGLIISSLVILIVTYIGVSNFISLKQVEAIKNDLAQVVEITNPEDIIKKKNEENINNAKEEEIPEEEVKMVTNSNLASLLTVNEDVVGELIINNTNINYPVVQAKDNDYYLDYDINHQKSINGWLFMDYRNDTMNLDKNNIIYGHNSYYSGVMFGTLYKTANKNWYTKEENQIITYNSLYDNMKFKIFSIYRVPKTSDYLKVYFANDQEFLDFVNMITKRSIYNFNVPINASDKILTLSTCSDNGSKRLVIHAVLIKE